MSDRRDPPQALRLLQNITLLTLMATPLAIGGVHLGTQAVMQLSISGVAIASLLLLGDRRYPLPSSVAWFAGTLLVLGLVQLIPLPPALAKAISPISHEWHAFLQAPPRGTPKPPVAPWSPLSLAPAEGWLALGRQASYLLYFLLCSRLFGREDRRRPLMWIAAVGAIGWGIALLHTLTDASRMLWLYELKQTSPKPFMGTFVNSNFQATFYGVTGLVALGLSRSRSMDNRAKAALGGTAVLALVGLHLTLSRGGILLLPGALALWFALARRTEGRATSAGLVVAILGVVSFGLALYVGASDIGRQLLSIVNWNEDPGWSKLDIWPIAVAIIGDFWSAGVGQGAFPYVFGHYGGELASKAWFTAPENFVLQCLTDYGAPGGVLILGLGTWVFIAAVRRNKITPSTSGMIAALAYALAHDLFDFALSSAGVMLLVVTLVAGLETPHTRVHREGVGSRRLHLGPVMVGAIALLVLLSSIQAWVGRDGTTNRSRLRLHAMLGEDTADFNRHIEIMRKDRPADHVLHWLQAERLLRQGPVGDVAGQGIHFINRALFLQPMHAPSHFSAAEFLRLANRRDQAIIEYRLAASYASSAKQLDYLLEKRIRNRANLDELVATARDNPKTQLRVLRLLRRHRGVEAEFEAMEQMRLLDQAEHDLRAARTAAGSLWVSGRKDAMRKLVQTMLREHSKAAWSWYWAMLVAQDDGDLPLALSRVDRAFELGADPELSDTLAEAKSTLLRRLGDLTRLHQMLAQPSHSARIQAAIYRDRGLLHHQQGAIAKALADLRMASTLRPDWTAPYLNIATVLSDKKRWELALNAYNKVLKMDPGNPQAVAGKKAARRSADDQHMDDLDTEHFGGAQRGWRGTRASPLGPMRPDNP